MSLVAKILGGMILAVGLAAAAVLADLQFDGARIVDAFSGRDRLVSACLPALREGLDRQGYAPTDLEVEARPGIGSLFGNSHSLHGRFTFADGPGEARVDGIMACLVVGKAVHVDFRATALPHRTA